MTALTLGARLAERHRQLTQALAEAEAFEALTEVVNPTVSSADIRTALERIEAHPDYQAAQEEQSALDRVKAELAEARARLSALEAAQ